MLWADPSGNVCLFGGNGVDSKGTVGVLLNDLCKFSNGQWSWMGGSNVANQLGEYGTQGMPSPNNIPGARGAATAYKDTSGNLWLFGGSGYDSVGTIGNLSDLWKYGGVEWTWMGGADMVNRVGSYGTIGTPSPSNDPGARNSSMLSAETSGNVWLFGGTGFDSAGTLGDKNDLWKYEP